MGMALKGRLVRRKRLISGFILLLAAIASWGQAEEALTADFLEYLGEYQQVGDEWVDPYSFAENLEQMAQLGKAQQNDQSSDQQTDHQSDQQHNQQYNQQNNSTERQTKSTGGSVK